MMWALPLAVLIAFECVADIFAKSWSLKGGWILAAGALLSYLIANTFWLFALQNGSGLARGAVIFSVASAVIAAALGIFFYKESLAPIQLLGICLGVVAIAFIFSD